MTQVFWPEWREKAYEKREFVSSAVTPRPDSVLLISQSGEPSRPTRSAVQTAFSSDTRKWFPGNVAYVAGKRSYLNGCARWQHPPSDF